MEEAEAIVARRRSSLFCKGRKRRNSMSKAACRLNFPLKAHMLPFGLAVLSPHQLLPPPPNPRPSRVPLLFDLGGRTLYFCLVIFSSPFQSGKPYVHRVVMFDHHQRVLIFIVTTIEKAEEEKSS